jgi:hypothetical protein
VIPRYKTSVIIFIIRKNSWEEEQNDFLVEYGFEKFADDDLTMN